MTFEEIDRLEAGRDADALVAALVPLPGVCLEPVPSEPGRRHPYWRYIEGGFREKFRPTTDPTAAALVLQWLRGKPDSNRSQVDDRFGAGPYDGSELDVCKAALLAVAQDLFQLQESRQVPVRSKADQDSRPGLQSSVRPTETHG